MGYGKCFLIGLFFMALPDSIGSADVLTGAARVGSTSYAIVFETARAREIGSLEVRVAVSHGEQPVSRAVVSLKPGAGTVTVEGRQYSLPPELAAGWWAQLTSAEEALRGLGARPDARNGRTFTLPGVHPVAAGLPGRIEVVTDPRGLKQLRFFGLEEWNNSFHDYFTLGLTREGSAE